MYNYEAQEVVGLVNVEMLHPAENGQGSWKYISDAALHDDKWEGIVGRLRKDGQRQPMRLVLTPRWAGDGQPVGFLLISKDVVDEVLLTQHKKLDQQLRGSQAYNRGLIEAWIDGLIVVDLSGRTTDVNEQMARMSGFPREKLIGTPFADYFADPERATDGMHETIEKGVLTDHALTLVAQDGRQVPLLLNGSVFRDPAGNVGGIIGSLRRVIDQAPQSTRSEDGNGAQVAALDVPAGARSRAVWTRCGTGTSPNVCRPIGPAWRGKSRMPAMISSP